MSVKRALDCDAPDSLYEFLIEDHPDQRTIEVNDSRVVIMGLRAGNLTLRGLNPDRARASLHQLSCSLLRESLPSASSGLRFFVHSGAISLAKKIANSADAHPPPIVDFLHGAGHPRIGFALQSFTLCLGQFGKFVEGLGPVGSFCFRHAHPDSDSMAVGDVLAASLRPVGRAAQRFGVEIVLM